MLSYSKLFVVGFTNIVCALKKTKSLWVFSWFFMVP